MAGTLTEPSVYIPQFSQLAPERPDWRRLGVVAASSLAVHVLLVSLATTVTVAPGSRWTAPTITVEQRPREVTRLVAPPSALTQRAPNKGKLTQEFDLASLPPRRAQANVPASPGAAAPPRQRFVVPDRKGPAPARVVVPEAPQVDAPQIRAAGPPPPALGNTVPGPPPQIEPAEKPKIAFERPGVPMGAPAQSGLTRVPVPTPSRSVEEAARSVARGGGQGLIVGDDDGAPGSSPSSPSVPIPGKLGSSVELLSDPQGVDFWPYLVKVLSTVRRNWFAIIPESARLGGRRGRTAIQFAIARDGSVPKLVIATASGTEALDRAAVAGISASNPFPPLPAEFRGSQIRLQFVFKYNVR